MRQFSPIATSLCLVAMMTPAATIAATPRDMLTRAAFATPGKAEAVALVDQALAEAAPGAKAGDAEAKLQLALATGYRGQLKRSLSDAKAARDMFTALAKANPRDPEIQVALAGWHLTAVSDLGAFLARTMLSANRDAGLAGLDRAVALGGNRAFYPGYAALIRLKVLPTDAKTPLALAERAIAAPAPAPLDKILQRAAQRIVVPLRAGNTAAAAKLADQLLPFGTAK